jgi:hypothetical protein
VLQAPESMVPACQSHQYHQLWRMQQQQCYLHLHRCYTPQPLFSLHGMILMCAMVVGPTDLLVRAASGRSAGDSISQLRECLQDGQHRWLLQAPQQAAQRDPQRNARLHIPA